MRLKVVLGPDPLARRAYVIRKADKVLDWPLERTVPKVFRKIGIINFCPDGKAEDVLALEDLAEEVWLEGDILDPQGLNLELLALVLLADEVVKLAKTCQVCGGSGIIRFEKGVVLCRRCLVRKGWLFRLRASWTGRPAGADGN